MKVLQICSKPPVPEIDGGCKAMNSLTEGLLQNNVKVKVLTLSTHKHPFKKEALPEKYLENTGIENVKINTKVSAWGAFLNLCSSKSYNIERFYSREFEDLIVKTIQENQFDVILLESLYVTMYVDAIRRNTGAKIVYRAHNIEAEIWKRKAAQAKGLKKIYLGLLTKKLANYEKSKLNHFDAIASITEKDKQALQGMGCHKPITVIPFGIDMGNYQMNSTAHAPTIFHIGSMDWEPNQHGIKWFLEKVWNHVVAEFPEVQFNLAGKSMPDWLLKHQQKNVNILGEVDRAIDFINQNTIMIVPLFAGSGMRIKIIEGMALGKTVIATSIAAEGIKYESGEHILIADTAEEFIHAIVTCLTDKTLTVKIGDQAKKMVASNYDNKVIVNNLVSLFNSIQK